MLTPGRWFDFSTSNLPVKVTDAENDPIVTYRFTDIGSGPASADLWFSGLSTNNGYVAQGGSVDVPANQLTGLWIQGGSVKGTDTLQVQVYNGYSWSTAQNITVISDDPPVVAAAATSVGLNRTVALSSIFTATDPDGDTVTQYQVSNATVGGAHLLFDSVPQAENKVFTINAADLSHWQIASASTNHNSSQFEVSAYDGINWSTPTTINLVSGNTPSVVTVTGSLMFKTSQWLNFGSSNLPITVTDADGDPVVSYRLTEVGAGSTSAQLWYGSGYVAQGGTVTLTAAQLGNLWIQGGAAGGTDTLQVQVYDGSDWSTAQNITITTRAVNHAPVVSAATTGLGLSQTVAASTIFSVSDSDGDAITQYKITNSTVGGSYLLLNNVQQADNAPITVTAAQLAQLQIVSSSTDRSVSTFTVQAYDGFDWSASTSIAVTSSSPDHAASVAVTGNLIVLPGGWLNITPLNLPISVTDIDGDPVVAYRFTDLTSASNSAYLWFNGAVGQGGVVTVPVAQLSSLWIHGATGNNIDTLKLEVSDGYQWSTAETITVATRGANHAPVVTAATTSFGVNQTIAASTIFKVTDTDSDAIIQYKITDATTGGAHLLLNSVQQAENTPITISAANLSQLQIVTSSANHTGNTFTVQAFDGYDWSAATSINVTTAAPDSPSVVTVNGSVLVTPGASLNLTAANLPITVTDADADPIVSYRFTDLGTDVTSAQLLYGSGYVAQGGSVTVTPAQLGNLWIQGGSANGTDALQVQVYDGYQWSAAQNITINTHVPNHAPVVAAATTSFGLGQTVAASSIFSVTDADNDAITQYKITDASAGGAYLTLNGVQQADGAPIAVTAAQLAQLQVVTASSNQTNTFTVQAYDGFDWSAPVSVNVTSVSPDHPSVITVTGNLVVQTNSWLEATASTLPITVTDADGDPVVSYRFTDLGTDALGAYLWFSSSIAQGGSVTLAASQLSSLWVHGATAPATEVLQVEVYDGYQWSAPQDITLITHGIEHVPVVSAAAIGLGFSQTAALSSIFNVTDADGDAIAQYQVSDATAGGAHLLLDGVQQAENTVFTINAADLSHWQVVTSAASHDSNTFQISAFDGLGWSSTTNITVVSGNHAPIETATGALQFTPSQWLDFSVGSLPVSVTDADGDSVVSYKFTDLGTGSSTAHLWYGGSYVAQGGSVTVAAGQLGNLWVQGGSSSGIDTLRVQTYDGFSWSAPQDIAVITSPSPVNSNADAHVVNNTIGANDVLSGTAASDTFVFAPNFGNDTVNNYTPGQDVIAIDHSLLATVTAVVGAIATDLSGNAVIHVDANDSITLNGVSATALALHLTDFHIL